MKYVLLTLLFLVNAAFVHAADSAKKLRVVASFLPMYAHAAKVAGDKADVSMLLSKGAGPHDYSLRPSDVQKLREADSW